MTPVMPHPTPDYPDYPDDADHSAGPDAPPPECDPHHPNADLLLWAYRRGLFPMARRGGEGVRSFVDWFFPDPRAIIPLDGGFHVPRNLARLVRRGPFIIRSDTAFEPVMRACAQPRPQEEGTWIDERLIAAYTDLHHRGHAHSVEAWLTPGPPAPPDADSTDTVLVGGLYGVHIGAAFMGESMFIRPELGGSGASKVCLVHLVAHLCRRGFTLLDTQFTNEHLEQFGVIEITPQDYGARLAEAVDVDVEWNWVEFSLDS